MTQINGCGERAANRYENLVYWTYNWRKAGGSQRMIEISKREKFYQQEYCGCVFSLRDTNKWRKAKAGRRLQLAKPFTVLPRIKLFPIPFAANYPKSISQKNCYV